MNRFPFLFFRSAVMICKVFTRTLGPTHPYTIAVGKETSSAATFKAICIKSYARIIATTIKICSNGSSRWSYLPSFTATILSTYSLLRAFILIRRKWLRIGGKFSRHPFSGLIHSTGELLHIL